MGEQPAAWGRTMEITVVDWNVKGHRNSGLNPRKRAFIESQEADVLLLQELTPAAFRDLEDQGWSGVHALQLLPKGHRGLAKGNEVAFACAVLTRGDAWRMSAAATNLRAPSPERWLTARLEHGDLGVGVGSFACPPGVDWDGMKTEQGRQIAEWMACRNGPVIAGLDRNGPKCEWADGTTELWPRDAPQLLGPHPGHRLRDVLLTLLAHEEERREEAAAEHPDGPLAVSYIRGHPGQTQTRCRYDVIYTSEPVEVADVRYLYDEAVEAGSDHAAVVATLRLDDA